VSSALLLRTRAALASARRQLDKARQQLGQQDIEGGGDTTA